MSKERDFVSAVIYVHNAENRIEGFLRAIIEIMEENFEHSEIICVNDSSDDNSSDIIREVSKNVNTASISILTMSYYHGLETAMNAGMELSIGDFVFEFDSTILDFDKSEVMKIYRKSKEYDIVSASPDTKQRLSSKFFYYIFERFTNLSTNLYTESFRILSRRVINRISSMNKTIPYRKAIYAHCGLKTYNICYQTVPVTDKTGRLGKEEKKYRTRLAVDTLILFTQVGYCFSISMTSLMILTTVIMAVYSLVTYVVSNPIEGWTTTILFLSFSFFGLFGILTVIIKYLQIIVELIFKRKRYSFEEIEKLTK